MYTIETKEEIDGRFSCHIPEYHIHYCAKDKNEVERKGKIMVEMYEKFIEENPQYK